MKRCFDLLTEIKDDIWKYNDEGKFIVVSTNGFVKKKEPNAGCCVMGKGIALQAKLRFPNLPKALGDNISANGNRPFVFLAERIITFPVKNNWWEKASVQLIDSSCRRLLDILQLHNQFPIQSQIITFPIYIPHVGCMNGGLDWERDVKPIFESY